MTKVIQVNLEDVETLRSVGSMCPHLKEASFSMSGIPGPSANARKRQRSNEDNPTTDAIDRIRSILNGWPKVLAQICLIFDQI